MKKRFALLVLLIVLFTTTAICEGFDRTILEDAGLIIEDVHVSIPGLTHTYHFLWLSDLHIVIDNDEIADDMHDFVAGRQTSWANRPDGKQAGDWWMENLAETINLSNPDAILFGGDMLDLCTEATVDVLKQGIEKITVPYLYIRADHDIGTHWLNDPDPEKNKAMQDEIADNSEILTMEFPEFVIVGINNSTSQMSDFVVDEALKIASTGKPIIVITHVPYDSIVDRSLDEISRSVWQDRNLTWGAGTSYVPGEKMSQWMDALYNGSVVEVLAGHLHLTWDGMISDSVHEHVFSQGFSGYVGVITVDGE